jgi:hypothetical protein
MLDEFTVTQILEKCNLNGYQLYTSKHMGILKSQGLYHRCLDSSGFKATNSLIIGDDKKQDLIVGKSLGIKTFKVPKVSERLEPILNKEQIGVLNSSDLGKTYLKDFVDMVTEKPSLNLGYASGFFYSGLLANTTAREIIDISQNNKVANFVFLSREGYLIKRATDKYLSILNLPISTYYLFASRSLMKSPKGEKYVLQQILNMNLLGRSIIFDVGWRGKFLGSISQMIKPAPLMIMIGIWPWRRKQAMFKTTYFRRRNPLKALTFRKCPEIIEFLLTAPHESVITSRINPISKFSWEQDIIDGAEKSPIYYGDPKKEKYLAFRLLSQLLSKPSLSQAQFFGNIRHSIEGETPSTITEITKDGKILWLAGSRICKKSNVWDRLKEIQRRIFEGFMREASSR